MIIANRLRDGLTVFLGAGGQWVVSIRRGAVAHTDAEAARLLAMAADAAARNVVVNPYLIAVRVLADGPVPVEWREAIRASGPTIGSGRAA
jgi:hypothetical protein